MKKLIKKLGKKLRHFFITVKNLLIMLRLAIKDFFFSYGEVIFTLAIYTGALVFALYLKILEARSPRHITYIYQNPNEDTK